MSESPAGILQETETRMGRSLEVLKREFATVRTGRASAAILDPVRVDYYGTPTPITQMASVNVPDAHTLEIKPWDISALAAIEKEIMKSNLGLTPVNDGKVVRLAFPPLTEERRREFVKQVHKLAEDMRVELRTHRRKGMEQIKTLKKDKAISEDDEKAFEVKIQKVTDDFIGKIDQLAKSKERELMEV
ncbi:MAG: ribosome recycling factor [Candidatus Firestonebacteria bacterium]|nr:ribosome recycling factor [Candidatus Firestonebacteria bacterium]